MTVEEEHARYWKEKKSQYQRALDFIAEANATQSHKQEYHTR